jgi:hypothetical protein
MHHWQLKGRFRSDGEGILVLRTTALHAGRYTCTEIAKLLRIRQDSRQYVQQLCTHTRARANQGLAHMHDVRLAALYLVIGRKGEESLA